MKNRILYIGNDLSKKSNYKVSMEILSENLMKSGFKVVKYSDKTNPLLRLIFMILGVFKNRNHVDFMLIDTYSTLNFYYAWICSQLARVFKIKYISILHGGNLPYRLKESPVLSRMIFKNSYINVAPSNYLKEAFEKEGYTVMFIPNTINIYQYPFKKRESFQPKIFWVRAFAEIYNPVLALEVLKKLKEKYPEATLCMVGPDREGILPNVAKKCKELGLETSVEFTGVLSKNEWHKKSEAFDIFINTTNVDNTPVSVIEAMALGLPVLSTNVGGIPYLIEDKIDGLLVNPNNIEEMVLAIQAILQNRHGSIAVNARRKVESFDWEIVKHDWIKLLS